MRIKTLTKHNFGVIRKAIIVFYSCFMAGTLFGSFMNSITSDDVVVMGVTGESGGTPQNWSTNIMSFVIFMFIVFLIQSQKDTRFLISRSVSRKEIFVANSVLLIPLAAIMSALQIVSTYIDGFVRWLLGRDWRGLALDLQIRQAPNMNNIFVFFVVSFSILLMVGAIGYLFGSLIARWKFPTLIITFLLFLIFVTLLGTTDLFVKVLDILKFMFIDDTTGLLIALKQSVFAALVMTISFPIMRRVTATKQ